MRRTGTVVTVVASVLAGGMLGVGLHAVWDPFDHAAGTSPVSTPSGPSSGSSSGSSPSRPTPSSSRTPSPSPSSSPSPSQSPSQSTSASTSAPPFTERALLQPDEFVARGWVVARRTTFSDQLPEPAITPCTTVDPGRSGVQSAYAATYASNRTTAAEVVVRFDEQDQAIAAYSELRAGIGDCGDASDSPVRVKITGPPHHPDVSGVDDLRWWSTRALGDGPARGVVGIVRVGDRIALLSLSSDVNDPAVSTEIESLLTQAGLRLV